MAAEPAEQGYPPFMEDTMYHFTIIDEASLESEQKSSNMQESTHQDAKAVSSKKLSLRRRTSLFLQRYLDKKNSVRIITNNN